MAAQLFPHVAQTMSTIDPVTALRVAMSRNEGQRRLKLLRPVLRLCGLATPETLGAMLLTPSAANNARIETMLQNLLSGKSFDDTAWNCPKACLQSVRYRRITSTEADALDPEMRAECVPIAYTGDLAVPFKKEQGGARQCSHEQEALPPPPPTLVVEVSHGSSKHMIVAIMLITRGHSGHAEEDEDACASTADVDCRFEVTVHSADKPSRVTRCMKSVPTAGAVLLDRLFADLPAADPPAPEDDTDLGLFARQARTKDGTVATGESARWYMPDELAELVASILQDHFRLHVLLNAACDPSVTCRPVALQTPTLSFVKMNANMPGRDVNRAELCTFLHPSSGGCICKAHDLSVDQSARPHAGVRVVISVCGCALCPRTGLCPIHPVVTPPTTDEFIGQFCMINPKVKVICTHLNSNVQSRDTLHTELDIPGHVLSVLLSTMATALAIAQKPLDKPSTVKLLYQSLEEADEALKQMRPPKSVKNDMLALDAMRRNLVQRGPERAGRSTIKAVNTGLVVGADDDKQIKSLRHYASLFRPMHRLIRKKRRK